jgi:hypothetical protein
LLKGLKRAGIEQSQYTALTDCGPTKCGRKHCAEACAFGARRRRLQEILAVYRLIKATGGPVHEVRLTLDRWGRPKGALRRVSIQAARKLNSRALDSLYNPDLVAVGTVKVAVDDQEPCWTVEVHEIVAGADKSDLKRAFANLASIKELTAKDLGQAISEALRRDLQQLQHPFESEPSGPFPKANRRAEFYKWVFCMSVGARMIRYGCDRYLNKLAKKPRTIRPKVRKKRRYPRHLEHHMFGGGKWRDVDPHSGTFEPKKKAARVNGSRDDDYYTRVY